MSCSSARAPAAFDVSKQVASGLCAHGVGMMNAAIINSLVDDGDECSW
jgi:hypothetical protein